MSRPVDRGSTFIEILVSVVLLGTAGIAVLTALAAAATGAATQRHVSDSQAALASVGDVLTDPPATAAGDDYVACADPADYAASVAAVVTPVTVTVSSVEYWTGSAWSTDKVACASSIERLQRLTLSTTVDGATRTLAVVKRPAAEPTADLGPLSPSSGTGFGNVTITPTPGVTG